MFLVGIFLVVVGVFWLLQRAGVISGSFWTYFWPVVLIFVGLSFILGWLRWRTWARWCGPGDWHRERHDEGRDK